MLSSFRFAFRQLAKNPGFTAVAWLTLALGIGATTTFFSVLHSVVLREPPYPEADRLVVVQSRRNGEAVNGARIPLAELRDLRAHQRSLEGIAAFVSGRATLAAEGGAARVVVTRVTADLLPLLRATPAQGRNFTAEEEHGGRNAVVLLSHAFWQSQFGSDPNIVGRTVQLNAATQTVVGVMPVGFNFGEERQTDLWQPLDLDSRGAVADRQDFGLVPLGRLAPGVTRDAAEADFARVARELQAAAPADNPSAARWTLGLQSLRDSQFGEMATPLGALLAAAAVVLGLAGLNVSILFLLRTATRQREMNIRLALGAGRRHLVGQLLSESLVLCALGTAAGIGLAKLGLVLLQAFPPADIPRLEEASLNGPVLAFVAGLLALVTVGVSLAPAFSVLRARMAEGLAGTGRVTESRGAVRLRDLLTGAQIALAVLLLVSGGLALRSLVGLLHVDLGFDTAQVLSFKTNLTAEAYPDAARTNRFYEDFSARLAALPGVVSVGSVSHLPLSGEMQVTSLSSASNSSVTLPASGQPVGWRVVRGAYFETLGLSLERGRFFDGTDRSGNRLVAIVDDVFARRFWSDPAAALDQQVRLRNGADSFLCTIVGVVHRVKHLGPAQETLPEVYVPHAQHYQRGMFTVVRAQVAPETLLPLARAELTRVDPNVPLYFAEAMAARRDTVLALPRFTAGLVGAFAAVALLIAGVGVFGVTAYSINQRTREFGIRFALGAARSHVVALVLGRAGRVTLLGTVAGAVAAFWLCDLASSLLFEVRPTDAFTLAGAAVLMCLTTLLACLGPLRRALRINPSDALRAE